MTLSLAWGVWELVTVVRDLQEDGVAMLAQALLLVHALLLVPGFVKADKTRRELLERTLAQLMALQEAEAGNLPSSVGKRGDRLVQFCHGAPGVVMMWCRAWMVLRVDVYL